MGSSCGRVPAMGRGPAGAAAGVRRASGRPPPPGPPLSHPAFHRPLPLPAETTGAGGEARSGGASIQGVPLGLRSAWTPRSAAPCSSGDPTTPPTVLWAGLRVLVCPRGCLSSQDLECTWESSRWPLAAISWYEGIAGWASASWKRPQDPPWSLSGVPRAFSRQPSPASEDLEACSPGVTPLA